MQVDKSAAIDPLTTTNYHIAGQGVCCITAKAGDVRFGSILLKKSLVILGES
jgi:hypothetical protein